MLVSTHNFISSLFIWVVFFFRYVVCLFRGCLGGVCMLLFFCFVFSFVHLIFRLFVGLFVRLFVRSFIHLFVPCSFVCLFFDMCFFKSDSVRDGFF